MPERLVAAGVLDQPVADLLRLGARSRLDMLVTGPSGPGKTTLLAAVVRDLGTAAWRVVTVAAIASSAGRLRQKSSW
jgi:Flp pilus assembly CpaF family ATPase